MSTQETCRSLRFLWINKLYTVTVNTSLARLSLENALLKIILDVSPEFSLCPQTMTAYLTEQKG